MHDITEYKDHRLHVGEIVINGETVLDKDGVKVEQKEPSGKIEDINCTTWTDSGEKVEDTINAMLAAMREHGIIAK